MKQTITSKQWKEITEDQQYKLLRNRLPAFKRVKLVRMFVIVNIGFMIEFLIDNGNFISDSYIDENFDCVLKPEIKTECLGIGWTNFMKTHNELCDVLWEACVSILEQ